MLGVYNCGFTKNQKDPEIDQSMETYCTLGNVAFQADGEKRVIH